MMVHKSWPLALRPGPKGRMPSTWQPYQSWVFVNSVTVIGWGQALESYCKQPGIAIWALWNCVLLLSLFYLSTLILTANKQKQKQTNRNPTPSNNCCYLSLFPLQCLLDMPPALPSDDWHLELTNIWTQLRQLSYAHVLTLTSLCGAGFWVHTPVADCSVCHHLL